MFSVVPFTLTQDDFGMQADFQFVIRFADGMFIGAPRVQIEMLGNYPGTYYILDRQPV